LAASTAWTAPRKWGSKVRMPSHPETKEPAMSTTTPKEPAPKQLLHLVFGGELTTLKGIEFKDLSKLDIVGIYPNQAEAQKAWKAAAQRTVDNAHIRYFVVHMHRLLDPETGKEAGH
jgi:Domain of unknown function (DUF4170)